MTLRRPLPRLGLLAATTLLASCQTVTSVTDALRLGFSTYEEPPASQPHALVRVTSDGNVMAFPGSDCQSANVKGSGLVLTMQRIQIGAGGLNGHRRGVPGEPSAQHPFAEFRVPAGVPLAIGYGYGWSDGRYQHNCSKTVHFTPEVGQSYEFSGFTVSALRVCGVAVVKLPATPVQPPEPVTLQDAPRCKA